MSEENVEIVRRAFEEFNRTRKPDLGLLDPDIVWHTPADIPEHATLEGREAVDRHLSGYAESFDDFNTTVEELTQVGDCVVVAIRLMGRIKGTDDWLDLPGAQVWEFNALGWATRVREFRSVTEALEAAGLSEQAMSQSDQDALLKFDHLADVEAEVSKRISERGERRSHSTQPASCTGSIA